MHESAGFGLSPSIKRLRAELLTHGFNTARTAADRLSKERPAVALSESDLNVWGYKLLEQKQPAEAVAVLQLAVDLYPNSWNAYDSLGEIMEATGDRGGATRNYSRSLELNPSNKNAASHLSVLRKG